MEGPAQALKNIKMGTAFKFEGYVKLLNNLPGKLWQTVTVSLKLNITGGRKCMIQLSRSCQPLNLAHYAKERERERVLTDLNTYMTHDTYSLNTSDELKTRITRRQEEESADDD